MTEAACALCRSMAPLRESHIFPRFIIRWLRETSATGKLRNTGNLRRRHQDGPKLALLCGACEQRFSDHEKWFAESVFRPKVEGAEAHPSLTHASLLPFVVSLAWRCALIDGERLAARYPNRTKRIRQAIEGWRRHLLDPSLPAGCHYFFPLPDYIYVVERAERVNWYLHRSLDCSAMLIDHRPVVWWNIPGFAGISSLGGHPVADAVAHRVSRIGLTADAWSSGGPQILVDLIMGRAREASDRLDQMPAEHWATIAADYRKNIDKWVEGPAAAIAELDYLNAQPYDLDEGTA